MKKITKAGAFLIGILLGAFIPIAYIFPRFVEWQCERIFLKRLPLNEAIESQTKAILLLVIAVCFFGVISSIRYVIRSFERKNENS